MDDEWDVDDTFVGDYESDEDAQSIISTGSFPSPCVALYNFEVMKRTLHLVTNTAGALLATTLVSAQL